MAWNEPEDDKKKDKKNDPWSGNNDSPPDLDEAFKNIQKKLKKALGGGKGGHSMSGSDGEDDGSVAPLFMLIFVIAVVFWALSGIFIVKPAEEAVILRFGKYVDTVGPGPHWIPRFINQRVIRNVDRRQEYEYSSQMLTRDENLVNVAITVQYQIDNLRDYLFNATDPQESLRQATASALRQVVGHNTFDEVTTEGRDKWGKDVEKLIVSMLARYKVGLVIRKVSPQKGKPPQKVQAAFDDAIKAREDEIRFKKEAEAYQKYKEGVAHGKAKSILEKAKADKAEVVYQAIGEVAEFNAILPEYKRAPNIMRERMYLNTMQQVLSRTSKILVDGRSGNMFYLPIDRLLNQHKDMRTPVKPPELDVVENVTIKPSTVQPHRTSRRLGRRLSAYNKHSYGGAYNE